MTLKRYLPILLLAVVVAALYLHTLHVPFYLDDHHTIAENANIREFSSALHDVWKQRGFSLLTFALNYRFGGLDVVGFHLVNISIHFVAGCLALLLARRIFPARSIPALFVALLFVAHPLQTQGVTYLVQRMSSLSALLFMGAVLCFARAREELQAGTPRTDRRHLFWYGAALLNGALAVFAKEHTVVLPLVLLLYVLCFTDKETWRWRSLLLYLAPFALVPLLVVTIYFVWPLIAGQPIDTLRDSGVLNSMEGNSPLHYLATQCSVLWIYLRMFVLPFGQAIDHGYPVVRELLNLKTIAGMIGLIGLCTFAWCLRKTRPAVTFGVGWFFLSLLVESSFIPLDPLFEHRLYLPIFGLAVCAASLLSSLQRPSCQIAIALAVLMPLTVLTWQRNALWNDPVALYEDNASKTPENERVLFNLGQEYLIAGRLADAEHMVRQSLVLNPRNHLGYLSLKEIYLPQGRIGEAIDMLHYGVEHADRKGPLYSALAFLYGGQGNYHLAIEMLENAIDSEPNVAAAYFNLAQMQMFLGHLDQVEVNLRKTLEINPGHVDARIMLEKLGDPSGSR